MPKLPDTTTFESHISEDITFEPNKPAQRKKRAVAPTPVYPDKPLRKSVINDKYIRDFFTGEYKNPVLTDGLTKKDLAKWGALADKCVKEQGKRNYFAPFKQAFVDEFFPELNEISPNPKEPKQAMSDFLEGLM